MPEPEPPLGSSLSPTRPRKQRRKRTVYSAEQRKELEQFFETKPYPTYAEREALAARLNLEELQVQVWFKNRRARQKAKSQGQCRGRRQGQEAPAEPQGPRVCAPAPAPSSPAFLDDPLLFPAHPVFPGGPVLPAHPIVPGSPGFCSPPPPSPGESFPEAGPNLSRHSQACLHPAQGAQDLAQAAPAPTPALGPACPQGPCASNFSPDPVASPGLTELLSLQDPLEGPSSAYNSGNQAGSDFMEENDWDPYRLLDL